MSTPLRVLLVEDSPSDAKLMVAQLREAGFDPQWDRVENEKDFAAHLERGPDLILSDFSMPQFNGLRALQHLRERNLDIPFIFVSGTIGDDVAVQAMREGAADYLHKDRPARLGQAVRRALEQKALRDKNRQIEGQLSLQASALAAAKQRLQHVVTSSPAVLFTLAITGEQIHGISWISDNLLNILGHPPEAALRPDWWHENIHPTDRNRIIVETHAELFRNGSANQEYRFRHGDGAYRWTRGELRLIRDGAGQAVEVVGSWSDITERKQLEEQFCQAQKMEAVGRLAGGVAHDFNNLLTIICGYGQVLKGKARLDDPSRPMLEEIVQAGERATMLTRQLLTFSRHHVHEVQLLDLNVIIRESEKMLGRLIGEDIQIETRLAPTVRPVLADSGRMGQILMNLAVNARDAMRGGGRLLIETSNVDLDNQDAAGTGGSRPGSFVQLSMTDTGCGMDEATKLRIFEPFFTTKAPDKGTGLGLSTVYGIVHTCGGHIEVDSEVGRGTTFRIYLPEAQMKLEMKPALLRKAICAGGAETIMLVDDDVEVRKLASHLLQNCGYEVLEAGGGPQALALAERRKEPIHLLLTDVVMPEMSGNVLADRLKCIHPETAVLFMSGYTGGGHRTPPRERTGHLPPAKAIHARFAYRQSARRA
jgi:two-component system, cell cycle sensor histidine kinase and response regulator CckA